MSGRPAGSEARRYKQALKAAVQGVLDSGAASQREIGKEAHVSPTAVSRYFSGERVAPDGFVDSLAAFASRHGHPLGPEVREELHRLRRIAEAAGPLSARLRHAQEQIEQLKRKLAAAEATALGSHDTAVLEALEWVRGDTARQLVTLEGRLEELTEELVLEKRRVRVLEAERNQLRVTVREQGKRLADAGELVRSMNADLEHQEEELQQLRLEVEVLRGQLARISEETVPGVSTQLSDVSARRGSRSAEHTGTASPRSGSARGPRSVPREKPGGRPEQVPDPTPRAPATTAEKDKPRVRLVWPLEPLCAAISVSASICAPLLVVLNSAAVAAASGSRNGPPLTGIVLLAVAGILFTVIGYVILIVIAVLTGGLAGERRPLAHRAHRWALLASIPALALGIYCLSTTRVTNTGLWWLHHFGITA
ncbi:hypothetical protein [Streptomyces anulatus]|uniref:hypothetical protein n=1 Tax=Streptomyces anulatus TaxID=1892 RepID=UPI001D1988B7|nr:hypothetical protein [Streptomyces anulatus]